MPSLTADRFCLLFIILGIFCIIDANVVRYRNIPIPKYLDRDESLNSTFKECFGKLDKFSIESSKFTKCLINNARPFTICRRCSLDYNNTLQAYNDIKESITCNNAILNADRVQIVEKIYEEIFFMWKTANCDNCYDDKYRHALKNSTQHFFTLINKTLTCFDKATGTICSLDKNLTHCSNSACIICLNIYNELNKVYNNIQKKYDFGNLCMDIIDAINSTRKIWSSNLDCIRNNNDTFVLFIVIYVMCLLPIVFYLNNWIHSVEHKSRVMPQKRLLTTRIFAQLPVSKVNQPYYFEY